MPILVVQNMATKYEVSVFNHFKDIEGVPKSPYRQNLHCAAHAKYHMIHK